LPSPPYLCLKGDYSAKHYFTLKARNFLAITSYVRGLKWVALFVREKMLAALTLMLYQLEGPEVLAILCLRRNFDQCFDIYKARKAKRKI